MVMGWFALGAEGLRRLPFPPPPPAPKQTLSRRVQGSGFRVTSRYLSSPLYVVALQLVVEGTVEL